MARQAECLPQPIEETPLAGQRVVEREELRVSVALPVPTHFHQPSRFGDRYVTVVAVVHDKQARLHVRGTWLDGEIAPSASRKSCRQSLVELLSFRWVYAVKQANDNACLLRESLEFT